MNAVDETPLEFAPLRERGIALLQRLTAEWTDHNSHDPGITILEQVCYALTDLGYRTGYSVPDLMAAGDRTADDTVFTPAAILPSGAVTRDDLRKIVLDVPGVKNAWIEPVDDRIATHDGVTREVRHAAASDNPGVPRSPNVTDLRPLGLYRVWIEKSDLIDIDGSEIRREAARRLHAHRSLGEDFVAIDILDIQPVYIDAAIEIAAGGDAVALLATIYERIAAYCSPAVRFRTLDQMLAAGRRVDEIFEGPLLDHGFIEPGDLATVVRHTTLRISDLIREMTAIAGVVAVKKLRFIVNGQASPDWLLTVEPDRSARFDLDGSTVRLERRSLRVDSDALRVAARALFVRRAREAARPEVSPLAERDLAPPPGRDRQVARYESIQHHFPMVYGVGAAGLSREAPPRRRVQAKQLQAYLLLIDQLLANQFAQLANVRTLLSTGDESTVSYFSQPVPDDLDAPLGLDALRLHRATHAETLQRLTEDPGAAADGSAVSASGVARRNRLLDHLLARVGEQFSDYALLQFGLEAGAPGLAAAHVAREKRAFLRDYPRIGRDRGIGFNYLAPAASGSSELLPGDCVDPVMLARRWADVAPDPVSAFLWSRCTVDEQAVLGDPQATPEGLDRVLCAVLNRVLDEPLYDAARFAAVARSPEAEQLLTTMAGGAAVERRRLNRVLLEDAYPSSIARSRNDENMSGLELLLRRRLGIRSAEERFHVVEHILLRPVAGDARQHGALFKDALRVDPYSLQVSLVFPDWPARYQDPSFRQFVEETVRDQAPAHLAISIRWLTPDEMRGFEQGFAAWVHNWRNQRRAEVGL